MRFLNFNNTKGIDTHHMVKSMPLDTIDITDHESYSVIQETIFQKNNGRSNDHNF